MGASLAFMVQSVSFFGMDAPTRTRELGAGLSPLAYFLGKATAALGPALCLPLLFYLCVLLVAANTGRLWRRPTRGLTA
jgi:ABC-type dipeptide/oligopeptide/nickel transport system permease subunit